MMTVRDQIMLVDDLAKYIFLKINCAVFTQQTNNGCKLLQLVN